ncbi:MAG TPA: DUF899 domain-containing protein [Acidimicrobiia bacterium]|jgi:predicted dithiol-disulfide oxidoreductase (DUF899 family)
MSLPDVVTREEWLAARRALLADEKAMTRARDTLSAHRRELPMVLVDDHYRFAGPDGEVTLADLFEGRRQLIVQHFMFDPEWDDGCPSCTAAADEMSDGLRTHLAARDTTFAAISRAPLDKLERWKAKKGWTFPWYSSFGSSFNYDFHVTIDPSVAPVMFNYRNPDELEAHDLGWLGEGSSEQPGYSCFLRDGDRVFHTYSTFARGCEALGGSYYFLDMTALGRQEEWEVPKGRADAAHANVPSFES